MPVDALFSEFSEPIAAASIAQVHKARAGRDRPGGGRQGAAPGIERAFRKDVDAFYLDARDHRVAVAGSRRLRPLDVIAHFESVVMRELDLRLEAAAAASSQANTARTRGFACPRSVWFLSAGG